MEVFFSLSLPWSRKESVRKKNRKKNSFFLPNQYCYQS